MNFNKIPETNEIKKSKAICPLCYGNGDVPVENPKTGVWEMMPCPKCAEINTKIDAKSAEIPAVEVLEEAAKTPNEPVIFVENGKQFKDQASKIGLHFVLKDMPDAILECGKVMQNGYKKYPIRRGWLDVPADDVDGAICRHSNAHFRGEKIDPESKCYHLAHLAINALMNLQKEIENGKSL
jgi:hypothetical protein